MRTCQVGQNISKFYAIIFFMQEAFRLAEERSGNLGSRTQQAILKAEYNVLGQRFFRTVVAEISGRGRIDFPSLGTLQDECLRLHTGIMKWSVQDRSFVLSSLTHGLRISEENLHPTYRNEFFVSDISQSIRGWALREAVYTNASAMFFACLCLLYDLDENRCDSFRASLRGFFGKELDQGVVLPQARFAAAALLGQLKS